MKQLNNVEVLTQPYYKVFCDFHDKDIKHFFNIKDDIFNICKCAIFYRENHDVNDAQEQELCIKNSNLYVLIVSSKVLSDVNFDKRPFQIAQKNNVPILPIFIENGIEEIFNNTFGNLQCINKAIDLINPTAVPYIEKLENFLSRAFSLSLDINMLRKAFDCSIFLSYRKKDRAHAQRLLDIIHSNDELKYVSVWYDEFLIPGEDFNEGIKDELQSSVLFMLVVTPNILENINYIKNIEYPLARSLNKTICPVELVKTDYKRLESFYPQIPGIAKIEDADALKKHVIELLRKNNIVISESTSEKDYYIGLAFLKGLCVEKNTSIAIRMISRAAEAEFLDAMKMLAHIYKCGDGCEPDFEKAVYWQNKYISLLIHDCKEPSWETADLVEHAYRDLSAIYALNKKHDDAADILMKIVEFYNSSSFQTDRAAKTRCAQLYEDAAELCMKEGNYVKARYSFLEKAINLRKSLYESSLDRCTAVDLCLVYLSLAGCQLETDDIIGLKTTIKIEMKELKEILLASGLSDQEPQSLQTKRKIMISLSRLGEFFARLNMEEDAFIYNGMAVNFAEIINTRHQTVASAMHLYTALKNDAMQHMTVNVENHLRTAEASFIKAHNTVAPLFRQTDTLELMLTVAESHLNLACIKHKLKDENSVLSNANTAIDLYEIAYRDHSTVPIMRKLCQAYYTIARIFADIKKSDDAMSLLNKGLEINRTLIKGSSLSVYKLEMADALKIKGDLLKKQWDFETALVCYAQRHELILSGACKNAHIYLIAESYQTLIAANKAVGDIFKANELILELSEFKKKYSHVFNGSVTFYS